MEFFKRLFIGRRATRNSKALEKWCREVSDMRIYIRAMGEGPDGKFIANVITGGKNQWSGCGLASTIPEAIMGAITDIENRQAGAAE